MESADIDKRLARFAAACDREQAARTRLSIARAKHAKAVADLDRARKARERAALAFERAGETTSTLRARIASLGPDANDIITRWDAQAIPHVAYVQAQRLAKAVVSLIETESK